MQKFVPGYFIMYGHCSACHQIIHNTVMIVCCETSISWGCGTEPTPRVRDRWLLEYIFGNTCLEILSVCTQCRHSYNIYFSVSVFLQSVGIIRIKYSWRLGANVKRNPMGVGWNIFSNSKFKIHLDFGKYWLFDCQTVKIYFWQYSVLIYNNIIKIVRSLCSC